MRNDHVVLDAGAGPPWSAWRRVRCVMVVCSRVYYEHVVSKHWANARRPVAVHRTARAGWDIRMSTPRRRIIVVERAKQQAVERRRCGSDNEKVDDRYKT